jgi:phosphomethylpyrimidine synthase
MTQLKAARKGVVTEEMKLCAQQEGVSPEFVRRGVEDGTIVVIRNNIHRTVEPLAIGRGLRTKINANIGTSRDRVDPAMELEKVRICMAAGADAIMDLSTGGDIRAIRKGDRNGAHLPGGGADAGRTAGDRGDDRRRHVPSDRGKRRGRR